MSPDVLVLVSVPLPVLCLLVARCRTCKWSLQLYQRSLRRRSRNVVVVFVVVNDVCQRRPRRTGWAPGHALKAIARAPSVVLTYCTTLATRLDSINSTRLDSMKRCSQRRRRRVAVMLCRWSWVVGPWQCSGVLSGKGSGGVLACLLNSQMHFVSRCFDEQTRCDANRAACPIVTSNQMAQCC